MSGQYVFVGAYINVSYVILNVVNGPITKGSDSIMVSTLTTFFLRLGNSVHQMHYLCLKDLCLRPMVVAGVRAWNKNDRFNYNVLPELDIGKLAIIPIK